MKLVIRYFFRTLRVLLTPVMLLAETLSTPKRRQRAPRQQLEIDQACQQLALYQFKACPFCIKVRKEIARLGLNIETRDAQHIAEHRQALSEGGGRVKVPCLRIDGDGGETEWLYESDRIKAWLAERFDDAVPASSR
ncbi:glutaredoxin family protein [Alloalcanivorax mobilis]|uniref:glutaredoxin family protein n=1 Tax=Alloalcanivorax mobilis TaxID=2019569 RepID=UPI000B5B3A3E|nr:glutaredoxin [Alloalcanivorax mobilis]ASK36095.1 glutaredoxin [Alcanivorax sp. N3-2A]|tara:strand:- start:45571 stop:45981 length:411 start_codon:yes stop_codon:yes gene_type:complete